MFLCVCLIVFLPQGSRLAVRRTHYRSLLHGYDYIYVYIYLHVYLIFLFVCLILTLNRSFHRGRGWRCGARTT